MIRNTGAIVLTPTHLSKVGLKKWLEVFPMTPKEISFYSRLDRSKTTHGEVESRINQSPLLIELSYARELGLK
jgi:hypothetical protein